MPVADVESLRVGGHPAGIRCVGAAVFDQTGRVVVGGVSLSVLTLEVSTPLDGYAPAVLAAARDISALLGAPAGKAAG